MRTCATIFRWLIVAGLSGVLPACTGGSGFPFVDGGLAAPTALGLDLSEAGLADADTAWDCIGEGEPAAATHEAMFEAVNLYRTQNGLLPLRYSKRLEAAANSHVRDLWARDFFDHVNPDGLAPWDRAIEAGFCHPYVGENIAAGQASVEAVMQAWKNSPPHDHNLLEPDFVYAGMGYFVDPKGRRYWGQLFAFEFP